MPEQASPVVNQAVISTELASDRTLLAWIRTALSMISFGFTIYKFLQYVREGQGMGARVEGPRNLGMSLILLGTGGLVAASIQHWRLLRVLDAGRPVGLRWSLSLTFASIISLIGFSAFLSVVFRMGPF